MNQDEALYGKPKEFKQINLSILGDKHDDIILTRVIILILILVYLYCIS